MFQYVRQHFYNVGLTRQANVDLKKAFLKSLDSFLFFLSAFEPILDELKGVLKNPEIKDLLVDHDGRLQIS